MTDELDRLNERISKINQKYSDSQKSQQKNSVPNLAWIGIDSTDGLGMAKNSTGEVVKGSVIFNSQVQPGEPILGLQNGGVITFDQMDAPYPKLKKKIKKAPKITKGKIAILAELIYETDNFVPCSCEDVFAIVLYQRISFYPLILYSKTQVSSLVLYNKTEISPLILYNKTQILPLVTYRKDEEIDFFCTLSILYTTTEEDNPTECACPKYYKRYGNRCFPICYADSKPSGTYDTLQECLNASEPQWPDPEGQPNGRGGGGYWILYIGHKQGIWSGFGYDYPDGAWSGGAFYHIYLQALKCFSGRLDYVNHNAPSSWINAKPNSFPSAYSSSGNFHYFNLPMVPQIDASQYGQNAIVSIFKNTVSTGGIYRVNSDGWFLYQAFNADVYYPDSQIWHSPSNIAWAICCVGKYVPVGESASPPSEISGINCNGVTVLHNPTDNECSYWNQPDPTCQDPGKGKPAIACPYPQDKQAKIYWVGGSKQTPVRVGKVHISDLTAAYMVATGANREGEIIKSSEVVRIYSGRRADSKWCKIESAQIDGNDVNAIVSRNPNSPPEFKDWKQSLARYDTGTPDNTYSNEFATLFPAINLWRTSDDRNIQTIYNLATKAAKMFMVGANIYQEIPNASIPGDDDEDLRYLVLKRDLIKEVVLCVTPFVDNTTQTEVERGQYVDRVYKIHDNAYILEASGWINQVDKAYSASLLPCKPLRALVVCNKDWNDNIALCAQGEGKALKITDYQSGTSYRIKVKARDNFSGTGSIEVWKIDTEFLGTNPSSRKWVTKLSGFDQFFETTFGASDGRDDLIFVVKNPLKTLGDTACISWDGAEMTVTLEAF